MNTFEVTISLYDLKHFSKKIAHQIKIVIEKEEDIFDGLCEFKRRTAILELGSYSDKKLRSVGDRTF